VSDALIIDDDSSILDLLEVRLGARGFQVHKCASGEDGLAAMAAGAFDVVITDLKMKEMDGLAFCKRAIDKWPNVPVIVMTGHGTMQAAIEALRVGAADFVTKPIELDELLDALERVMERASRPSDAGHNESGELQPLDEVEREHILRVLESTGGNKVQAARILGFDRRTLYRKLEIYGHAVRSRRVDRS